MQEDLKHKLDESNAVQTEETTIKVKERIRTIEETIKSIQNDQETIHKAAVSHKERTARQEISQTKVKERIRTIEETIKSIENDQETINKAVVSHKERTARQEISQTKAETSRKSFEETKVILEKGKEDLTKHLAAEQRKGKEVKESPLKAEIARETLEQTKALLEKEKEDMIKQLAAEQRKGQELKESLSMVVTNLNKVEERTTKLEDEVTQLKEKLLAEEKTAKEGQTSSIKVHASEMELKDKNLKLQEKIEYRNKLLSPGKRAQSPQGMLSRFLSDAEKENLISRSNSPNNDKDELDSVKAESVDTGIYSSNSTSTRHCVSPLLANGELLNPDLKVAVTVTLKGAHMHIPETGVELDIPTGAVQRKQLIEMTIIPFDKQCAPIENFSSNSSAVVELLPNKAIFDKAVRLKLPHCLQLKNDYKDSKNPVRVFVSHHEAGPPVWEEDSSAKCTLEQDHCIILLKQFCWVKYEINDKIVVAKRLKVFTAGKSIHANDIIAEMEVGYYMDLPGRAENMTASLGMEFCQNKPFVFVKDGELSLQLVLSKIVPNEWTYITPDDNPKIISYKSIADDKDTSCPFALEKSRSSERKPYCIFKIVQGNESVELSMRF